MKPAVKKFILLVLLYGICWALLSWAFDSAEGKPFSLRSLLLRGLFFGIFMALINLIFPGRDVRKKAGEEQP
jgi:hypothetical protein